MDVDDISDCPRCGAQWLGDDHHHICKKATVEKMPAYYDDLDEGWKEAAKMDVIDLRNQLEQARWNGQRFRDECERLQQYNLRQEAEAARLQASAAKFLGYADDLREALQNMMGIFDNPVARRRISGEFAEVARASGRDALEKTKELEEKP